MSVSVTIANVLASGGAPSAGNNVTASWTPDTTKQYLLAITSYVSTGSASPVISSVTGNGLTWTLIDTIQPDNLGGDRSTLHVYAARGGGGSAGTITIAWSTAPTRASWSLDEVTNGDIGLGAGTLPQADASGTSSGANPSATLGSALKSGSVTYAAAAFESSAGTLSAGSGYTALANVATQSLAWLLTEWDSAGSTTASASNSTTTNRHGIILVEIACAQFAHVGSTLTWDTGNPTLTPTNVGDLITVCEVTKLASTPMITGLSSSNVTWTRLTPDFATSTAATPTGAAIWIGKVTSTSAATVTITWAGGSEPAHWEAAVNEFESVFTDWALDTYGTIDSNSNVAYPSLTPAGPGELYVGIHYDDTGAVVGSTAGYTYEVTSHGNGALYNPACTSSAQAPTWGGGTVMGGIAALIKQAPTSDSGTAAVTLKKMKVFGHGPDAEITESSSAKALQRSAADKIAWLFDGSMLIAYWDGASGQVSQVKNPLTSQDVTPLITTVEDGISLWVDNSSGTSSDIWIASSDDDGSGAGPSLSVRHGSYNGSTFTWDASTLIAGTTTAATIQSTITWNGTYLMVFWWDGTSGSDRVSYAYTTVKAGTSGWSSTATFSESSTWSTIVQVCARHSSNLGATVVVYGGGSAMHYAVLPDASVPSIGNWGGRSSYDQFDDSLSGTGGPQVVIDEVSGDIHVGRAVVNVGGPTWDGVTYWHGTYNSGTNTITFGTRVIVDSTIVGTTGPADIAVGVDMYGKVYVVWTTDQSSDSMKYSTLVSPFTSAVSGGTFTTNGSNPRFPHVPAVSSTQAGLSDKLPVLYMDVTSSPYPVKLDTSIVIPVTGTAAVSLKKMTVAESGTVKDSGTASPVLKKMGVSARGHQGGVLQAVMVAGDASSATTITLDVPTTGGTALLLFAVGTAATDNPNVSTITLGGSSDNWVSQLSEGGPTDHSMTEFWSDLNAASGQTSIVVTPTGGAGVGSVLYWVFECNDLPLSGTIIDKSAVFSSSGFVSSWTVGPTASTTFAKERVFAVGGGNANSSSIVAVYTSPSAPWVTSQQGRAAGGIHVPSGICGYQEVSSTGTQSFAVSASSPTSTVDGLIVALTLNSDISGTADVTLKKMSVSGSNITTYTVWNDVLPDAGTSQTPTGQRNDSLVFEVTSDCTLEGIAFYVPSGSGATDGTTYTAALYTTVTGTSGTLVTSQAGSGTFTAGAWNWIPLNVDLTTGTWYSAVINSPNDLQYEHSWWGTGPGSSGIVVGPINVPSQAAAPGNVQQGFGGGTLFMPTVANADGSWYGIDVKVSTAAGPGSDSGTADVTLKKMTVAVTGDVFDKGTSAATFKKMTVAVTGTIFDKGTSAAVFRKMTVSGTGTAPVAGTAVPVLKKMTTFGSGKAKISGTISVSLRKMTDSGTGLAPIFGTISVTMVKMEVHASDHVPEASPLFLFSLF